MLVHETDSMLAESARRQRHRRIDAELRTMCGLAPVKDPKMPLYIFTAANAKDAGTPPGLSQGYGDAYVAGYAALWQLK